MRIILIQKDNSMSGSKTNSMKLQKKEEEKKERTQKICERKNKIKECLMMKARDGNFGF